MQEKEATQSLGLLKIGLNIGASAKNPQKTEKVWGTLDPKVIDKVVKKEEDNLAEKAQSQIDYIKEMRARDYKPR